MSNLAALRRSAFSLSILLGLATAAFAAPVTQTIKLADRVVIAETGGMSHTFLKQEAIDKGSFASPAGFTQRNLCDTAIFLPHMTVCFRPDTNGSRDEVVFEYGTFKKPLTFLPGYSATFYAGSTLLGLKSVGKHVSYQRWRWIPQGYRKRYRTIAAVEATKLLPPYRVQYAFNQAIGSPKPQCGYSNVFDTACVTMGMRNTGERDDVGHVTGPQGKYLVSQSEAWWNQVLAQAEAGSGFPWHIRDERGTPIDFYRTASEGIDIVNRLRLNAHTNNATWAEYLPLPKHSKTANTEATATTVWALDRAHQPSLFQLSWLMTGDPFYLEEMQFANSFNTLSKPWDRTADNLADLTKDQVRGVAWNLRTMIGLRMTTPVSVPGWLLPRSYFERQSPENAAEIVRTFVNGTSNLHSVLHSMSNGFWQQDFLTFEVAWATWLGLAEWKPVYDHAIQNAFARVNGTSGWERRCPTVYFLAGNDSQWTSWKNAWEVEQATNNRVVTDSTILCRMNAYTSYLNGVLSLATHIGTPEAETLHRWLQEKMEAMTASHQGNALGAKWAVAPRYAVLMNSPP